MTIMCVCLRILVRIHPTRATYYAKRTTYFEISGSY